MYTHLHKVHSRWGEGKPGVWAALDFSKAFDTTHHPLLDSFLKWLGIPAAWTEVVMEYLKYGIRFLVGRQASRTTLTPGAGVRQEDTLSPTLFSLLTAILISNNALRLNMQDGT